MGNSCLGKPKDSVEERVVAQGRGDDTKVSIDSPESPSHLEPIFVGKYDYGSGTDDELGFKKGDLLCIIRADEEDWWFARSKDTGKEGYIPSNHVAEWKSLDAEE